MGIYEILQIVFSLLMPLIIVMIKRNANSNDRKLTILYKNQEKMLESIQDVQLKVNDTENKTRENYMVLKEHKAETKVKLTQIDERLNSQSKRGIQNEKDIAILQALKKK